MHFEFATASRIVFGAGAVEQVAPAARQMGKRALVAGGGPRGLAAAMARDLGAPLLPIEGEPTLDRVRDGVKLARDSGCDVLIGIGGGSAIDAAKAIAALLTNGGDPLDYLEVIGRGQSLKQPSAPCIAVPTTAGTGAEVTRNAVLASGEHRVKASLRSPFLLPTLAVVDPDLTLDLPPAITASTGMDALTQLIEPFVSIRANPMTDVFCLEGMRRAATALPRVWEDGSNRAARSDMALASLFGGLALANAGLGAVHGFAAPVGGMFPAPHGAVCAVLLPHAVEINIEALRERAGSGDGLVRYETAARTLTGNSAARAGDLVQWLHALRARLAIPCLAAYGIGREHVADLVDQASKASSMKANPIALTPAELAEVLTRAL